jgi:hypothetical protein
VQTRVDPIILGQDLEDLPFLPDLLFGKGFSGGERDLQLGINNPLGDLQIRLHPFDPLTVDEQSQHLRGARRDLGQFRILEDALHGIDFEDTVAAHALHGLQGHFHQGIGCIQFRNRRLDGDVTA